MAITLSYLNEFKTSLYRSIEQIKSYRMIPKFHIFTLSLESYYQKIENSLKSEANQIVSQNFKLYLKNLLFSRV